MRELVIIGSSILIPPNPNHHHHHHHHHKPSLPTTKLSRHPPLTTVRWDQPSRDQNRIKYYADLASKLAQAGRFDDFSMIAETVIVSGVDPEQFADFMNMKLVSAGIHGLIREGSVGSFVEVLRSVAKLGFSPLELLDGSSLELIGVECGRLVNCGELEEVVALLEVLKGFRFTIKELVKPLDIIKACVNQRNPTIAIRYACILPHAHVWFCTIINEFGKKGDLVSALTVFEASKQKLSGPNTYAYRSIIDVCGLCGDHLKSRSIFEEMLAQDVVLNIYIFNSLMNVNAHDLSYTLQVYKHMQNLGVGADMASYNILLKACCLAGRVDLARDIYKEVQDLESAGVLKLDVFTYSTIIKVFADAKLLQMALKVKEDMVSAGVPPNAVTWSSLISACANSAYVEQAFQLFEEMILAGCKPNSQCFNILLHACVEACQYDRAFRLFQSWKGSGSHKTFGDDYKDNGRAKDPHHLSLVKKVPFAPTTVTYNILMKACGADLYRAKSLMDEMKTSGISPNHISWSILIDICGGSGNVEGAMRTLRTMRDAGIKPDVIAYTTAIKVCVESKDLKIAFSLFAEMKRCEIQPNLVTYNTLLRARSRYGSLHEVQQCLAVYQDMRSAGYKPNDYYLKELIEEWCEGVIQNNNTNNNQGQLNSCNRADLQRPQSLLLEKVASHLQKSIAESLAIDIQGLSKVEARIVVLAVLRMIKENYTTGHTIKDDMSIILGVRKIGELATKGESEVRDAIIKLLRNELGLEVLLAGPRMAPSEETGVDTSPRANLEEISGIPMESVSSARRPAVLERLSVTRKSLYHWLQRGVGRVRR